MLEIVVTDLGRHRHTHAGSISPSSPLSFCLQVTKNDEKVLQKETELKEITEKLQKHEEQVQGLDKQYQQALEEKNILAEQLQAETELCAEAEEMRARLAARKQEMEEIIHDMEARIEEEEEKVIKSGDDKKKLQQHIQVSLGRQGIMLGGPEVVNLLYNGCKFDVEVLEVQRSCGVSYRGEL